MRQFLAAQFRHDNIGQQQVDAVDGCVLKVEQTLLSVGDVDDAIAELSQRCADALTDDFFIFGNQHGFGAGGKIVGKWWRRGDRRWWLGPAFGLTEMLEN